MSTGNQYAAAVLWDTPANVFMGPVGGPASGMYIDQTLGGITASDVNASYTLSADLIRIIGALSSGQNSPTVAGEGITIGFANANTGAILASTSISYSASYAGTDTTPYKSTGMLTWSPSSSGVPIGTPINAFVGFRLDPNYAANQFNSVAVDNVVLASAGLVNVPSLTWTGADATNPMQWSTNAGVLNWSSSSSNATHYVEGMFRDIRRHGRHQWRLNHR